MALTPDECRRIDELYEQSRKSQNLPPTIEDPAILEHIAHLFRQLRRDFPVATKA